MQVLSAATIGKILRFFFIRDYNMEVEDDFDDSAADSASNESCDEMAYANEPLADEEWLKKYREEVKENEELKRVLQIRLESAEYADSW